MRTIAITGGIGSGKSTVCSILAARGVPVYDSDSAAKRLYVTDDTLLDAVEEAFGCSVRSAGKEPDFKKIASIVFSSKEKLKALESIVHPAVLKDFIRWNALQAVRFEEANVQAQPFACGPFSVMESAIILDQPEFLRCVDAVVLVDAPLQTRLKRACERDGAEPSAVLGRMAMQKFDLSNVEAVIHNDGSQEELETEVANVFNSLEFKNNH